MENFAFIQDFKTFCENKGHFFIAGGDEYRSYRNAVMDGNEYAENKLIVFAGFQMRPIHTMNILNGVQYVGVLGVGRKCESKEITSDNKETEENEQVISHTVSSLDETFQQKLDNRLSELPQLLWNLITDFCCTNNLLITDCVLNEKINNYDLNADFIEAQITIEQ